MNELIHFKEIIEDYSYRPYVVLVEAGIDSNNSRCLQCKKVLTNFNFSPFCGQICLGAWNSDRAGDAKRNEVNSRNEAFKNFSEIIQSYK